MRCAIVNGAEASRISILDRGLQFGDGVFETMLCLDGRPVDFDLHWRRLERGCAALGIPCPDLRGQVLATAALHGHARAVVKLVVTRGESQRGYRCLPSTHASWVLTINDAPQVPASIYETGVDVTMCCTRLSEEDPQLAGLKHLNRLPQVLARREWEDQYHDGLLTDPDGHVVEGCASNLFLVQGGVLVTPDLTAGGVCGIVRERVLAHAQDAPLAHAIRLVTRQDLREADEVFLTNSLYGIVPVRSVQDTSYPVGPLTRTLLQSLAAGLYF